MSVAPVLSESRSGLVEVDRRRLRFRVDRRAYRDDEIFRRERATIFAKCWLYLGHASEIAKPGDFVTRTIGGYDIIFNRNAAGEVRAYFNACSHRGATVCRERSGSTRVFTCPYHGWVYDLEGRLRDQAAKGGYPAEFNADGEYDLRPVPRLEVYRDFCFVNFNPRSGGLAAKLARYTVCAAVMALAMWVLQLAFAPFASRATVLGCALEYLRYVAAAVAAIFLGPLVFCRMNLAAAGVRHE